MQKHLAELESIPFPCYFIILIFRNIKSKHIAAVQKMWISFPAFFEHTGGPLRCVNNGVALPSQKWSRS